MVISSLEDLVLEYVQNLVPWAMNSKPMTPPSQTLKVDGKKVSLLFLFVARDPKYGNSIF